MREQFFACTLSKRQRVTSTLGILIPTLLLCLILGFIAVMIPAKDRSTGLPVVLGIYLPVLALMSLLFFVAWGHAPKGYLVASDGLAIVRRNGKKILLPKSDLLSAKACEPEILKGLGRDNAARGFFGNWGDFSCPALGQFRGYWTNLNLVVVRTSRKGYYDGTFLLSPDDRDQFLSRMDELINSVG